jgi:YHS domain-containing protein
MKTLNKNKLPAIDPVCGMQVDPNAKSSSFISIRGHSYYFCTQKCHNEFKQDPAKYTDILNITKNRKTWWGRYLDRVQKATNGKPPTCCQ